MTKPVEETPEKSDAENRVDIVDHQSALSNSIRLIKWLVVVLIVISSGNFVRSFVNQSATDRATTAAHEATDAANSAQSTALESRDVSQETLDQLRTILADFQADQESQPRLQTQEVIDALQAITRIEHALCGGECPP